MRTPFPGLFLPSLLDTIAMLKFFGVRLWSELWLRTNKYPSVLNEIKAL